MHIETLPCIPRSLVGTIARDVGLLLYLNYLDLSNNELHGGA